MMFGTAMETAIQVNIPYRMLLGNRDSVLAKRINPEIYFSGNALDTCNERDMRMLREALHREGLRITLHAPFMDLSPGGVDSRIKAATMERLRQTLRVASLFSPRMITFHPGYNKWFFDGDVGRWLESSIATWRPLVEEAADRGLHLALENIFEEEPSGLAQLLAAINSPNFGFCFDTGHFNLFSSVAMEVWFTALGAHMREVHLHDNCKQADDHLPVGDGEIDFDLFRDLLDRHRVSPIFTIEPHRIEDVDRSLEQCKRMLAGRGGINREGGDR